jgi:hypothetical protein
LREGNGLALDRAHADERVAFDARAAEDLPRALAFALRHLVGINLVNV